jgi:hypothetical protein
MNIKSFLALKFAKIVRKQISKWADNPLATQDKVFNYLIQNAALTQFGKDHQFEKIRTYEDFKRAVPVRDYEGLKDYIECIKEGQSDMCCGKANRFILPKHQVRPPEPNTFPLQRNPCQRIFQQLEMPC